MNLIWTHHAERRAKQRSRRTLGQIEAAIRSNLHRATPDGKCEEHCRVPLRFGKNRGYAVLCPKDDEGLEAVVVTLWLSKKKLTGVERRMVAKMMDTGAPKAQALKAAKHRRSRTL